MIIVCDLDGTLCFDGRTIASEIRSVLVRAKAYGHEIVFASARSYRDCLDVLGEDLADHLVIGLNGGVAYEKGELVFSRQLSKKAYQQTLDWCQRHDLPYFIDDVFHYSSYQLEAFLFAPYVDPQQRGKSLPLSEMTQPIKMVVQMAGKEELVTDFLRKMTAEQLVDISYHEHETCLYLNPFAVTKASTVRQLVGRPFLALGNDKNDIELFQAAHHSVQVGAYPLLTPYADEQVAESSRAVAQVLLGLFEEYA